MKIKSTHAAPALIIVVCALLAVSRYIDLAAVSGDVNPYLTVMIMQVAAIGLPGIFFCLLRGGDFRKNLSLKLPRLRNIPITVYSLLLVTSAAICLSLITYAVFPEAFIASGISGESERIASLGSTDSVYAAITFAVIPAILEEFLCRGILRAEYLRYGESCAVLMSSLMFAMLHFSSVRFPIYFAAGVILGLTASIADSVIVPMAVHTAYNIFALFFEKYLYKIAGKHSGGITLLVFIVVTVMLLSAVMFFSCAVKVFNGYANSRKPSPKMLRRQKNEISPILPALISPSFLILAAFYIAASLIIK